jgi:hypothetical protein
MQFDEIIKATKEALDRRDSRRDMLATKIAEIADAAIDAARVTGIDLGDGSRIARRRLRATCSQWANGYDEHDNHDVRTVLFHPGECLTRQIVVKGLGYFDGRNYQHQRGKTRDEATGDVAKPATVAELRAVARALPGAVAKLLSEAQAEAAAETSEADATIATL